jgi:CelD/BcsL family acetyltransferase involved in cellulose biosynthesis
VEVADNAPGDIELLFKLNKQRFGTASNFHKSHREDMYRELITKFHAEVTSVEVNGNTAAVALGILYNDTYVQMNMGVDTSIDYLGKFLIGNQIDKAIRLGAQLYDAGRYDVGWKESFHLYKIPQYKLVL